MTPKTPAHWHHLQGWSRVVYSFLLYRPLSGGAHILPPPTVCPAQASSLSPWHHAAGRLQSRIDAIGRGRSTPARGWVEKDGGRKWAARWILASRRRRSLPPLRLRGSTWLLQYELSIYLPASSTNPKTCHW